MSVDQEIDAIQKNPGTRAWMRQALSASLRYDPIDVSHDAERLANLLTRRADRLLGVKKAQQGPALAAITYALKADEGLSFLDLWLHGQVDEIRAQWPDAPDSVFQTGGSDSTMA